MELPLWEVAEENEKLIHELQESDALTRPMALVLASRGIAVDGVRAFLQPSLKDLVDPYALPGVREAAARLWHAVASGEHILIHGDYDTDGITASVLLAWCLRQNGGRVECFLPHRLDDGYGLTPESIEKARRDNHTLLVTVDCGINSVDAIALARQQGLDVIVTDHHQPGTESPNANITINPKLPGSPAALVDLAGVGVAFKLCHGFIKYGRENGLGGQATDLRRVLDLVALGTVADIVPLLHENRCLVAHGLKVLSSQQRPGIRALCEVSGLGDATTLRAPDITFRLAPRLNAAGRLGDPVDAMRLLEASGMHDAVPLATILDEKNRDRQHLEEETLRDAEACITTAGDDLLTRRTIMVWGAAWPQGVIGIVASRLARRYHRPCIVLTVESDGQWRGSARSVRRLNLVAVMEQCRHRLIRFGGHPMAAGLSVADGELIGFRDAFEAAVCTVLGEDGLQPQLDICGRAQFADFNDAFFTELSLLEPIGHGNPDPLFLTTRVFPDKVFPAGKGHSRGVLCDSARNRLDFIYFNRIPSDLPRPPWDIVYTPQINTYNGNRTPQIQIVDLRPSDPV
jgi:single-stranded-DNA-specific exonuclease